MITEPTELERLCRSYNIVCQSVPGVEQIPPEWQGREGRAWTVTLSWFGPQGKSRTPLTLTTSFFQGAAHDHEPTAADVLSSLLVDAAVEDYSSFEAWCADLGYDTDSRKAKRTYDRCLEMAPRVRAFCGNDDDVLSELRDAEH